MLVPVTRQRCQAQMLSYLQRGLISLLRLSVAKCTHVRRQVSSQG
jgi:hypothetical protein